MQQGAGARGRPEAKREREKESPATSSRRRRRRRPRCSRSHHPARARAPAASLLARMPCVFAATPPPLVALNPRAYTRGMAGRHPRRRKHATPVDSRTRIIEERVGEKEDLDSTLEVADRGLRLWEQPQTSLLRRCCLDTNSPTPPFSFPLSVVCGTVDRRRQRLAPRNVFPLAAHGRRRRRQHDAAARLSFGFSFLFALATWQTSLRSGGRQLAGCVVLTSWHRPPAWRHPHPRPRRSPRGRRRSAPKPCY